MTAALPLIVALGIVVGLARGVKVYDAFALGAKSGFEVVKSIAPNLCAAIVCLSIMRESGLTAAIAGLLAPALGLLGIPAEVTPLLIMRPLSGGASIGIVSEIINEAGPDSYIARVACVMTGSSETVFYTLAVYCSGIKAKGAGWVTAIALLSGIVSAAAAAALCKIM